MTLIVMIHAHTVLIKTSNLIRAPVATQNDVKHALDLNPKCVQVVSMRLFL